MTKKEVKELKKEILDFTAQYASFTYYWDMRAEEDYRDYKDGIKEILEKIPTIKRPKE